jgi:hypothetical protein
MQSFVASVNLELKCAEIALLISATWLQGLELGTLQEKVRNIYVLLRSLWPILLGRT